MTVSTSTAKAGPYAGSGTTGPFTVPFRFLENSHLRVIKTSTTGVETDLVLTTDYTVSGAGGASGTVTLTSPLLTGEKLTILRNVPLTQDADYVAGDAFPAETHERALDKLTMITQQLAEEVSRAVKVDPSSSDDPDLLVASVKTSELNAATSAAAAAAAFDAFDDRYLGSKASDPTVDNDGNALLTGALYWNTTANEMRVWDGSSWRAAAGSLVGMPETAQELAGGVNLNTIQTPGFYVQSQDADAASGTNYPVATAGALVVLKNAGGVSQFYYTLGSASVAPRAFFRALYNGSWSTWREIYHSGNLGAASETTSGIVELATAAEVQAGTDTVRAVTPAGLASLTATETRAGIVELATAAEAQAGTDGTRALSPLRLRDALNASGSAPIYACRAWVNFNGTGTVAIRASGNVSSITDNGVGDYTVNFITAMPDVNFSVGGTAGNDQTLTADSGRLLGEFGMASRTTSACRVTTAYVFQGIDTTVLVDSSVVSVQIFR